MSMQQHETTLRPATASLDDGQIFARYLDVAADGFFRFLLGRRSADILATAFTNPGHDLSYEHVTFAEQGKVIVGMISGYTSQQHRDASDQPLRHAAGRSRMRLSFLSVLCAPLMRLIDTISDGDFYLQAIATNRQLRGQGIGTTLMDSIEEQAVATGSARLVLDVAGKNEVARRFYERRGMALESRWPRHIPLRPLKIVRMAKTLCPYSDRESNSSPVTLEHSPRRT